MSIKNYEIIKELGSGSYSIVYEVICKATLKHYAMKKIQLDKLSKNQKKYTETEIQVLSELDHPYIIKFIKSFEEKGSLHIITELAPGGDLQTRINILKLTNGKMDLDTIWRYSYQIIAGLKELHSRNIIHRDIKATNIFMMNEHTIKIGDLGISKFIDDITSTQIGTPATMSPEIWNGEGYNEKADMWSLGCLIYQMASLSHAFTSPNYVTLYQKISSVQYKKSLPSYPPILSSFIEKLIQRDPTLRPSAEDLLKFKCFNKFLKNDKNSSNALQISAKTSLETQTSSLHKIDLGFIRKKMNSEVSPSRFFESKRRVSNILHHDFKKDKESRNKYFGDGSPLAIRDLAEKRLKQVRMEYGYSCERRIVNDRNCKSVERQSKKNLEKLSGLDQSLAARNEDKVAVMRNDSLGKIRKAGSKIRINLKKGSFALSATPTPVHKASSFTKLKSIY